MSAKFVSGLSTFRDLGWDGLISLAKRVLGTMIGARLDSAPLGARARRDDSDLQSRLL